MFPSRGRDGAPEGGVQPGGQHQADSKRKFLIGCRDKGQQDKFSRCQSLPGGVGIQCRIPVPTLEVFFLDPLPSLSGRALRQAQTDLTANGR